MVPRKVRLELKEEKIIANTLPLFVITNSYNTRSWKVLLTASVFPDPV